MVETAGAECSKLVEECRTEQKWLKRCSSEGLGSFRLSPPRQRRMMATSPSSSSAHPPSAWGWSSCPEQDLHFLRCPQMEVVVVGEEVLETVGADLLTYRGSFHRCQVPFRVRCPSLEVSFLS